MPKHFYAMADGYLRREYKNSAEARKLGYLLIVPHIDTKKHPFSFNRFCEEYWPLAYEDTIEKEEPEQDIVKPSKEEFHRIMALHNPKRYGNNGEKQNGVRKLNPDKK